LIIRQIGTTFTTNPLPAQYRVLSGFTAAVFQLFLSTLKGEKIEVTKADVLGFSVLFSKIDFGLKISSMSA
jgi:hypothetical protein